MRLRFLKMQACGNDFVVLDGIAEDLGLGDGELRQLAVRMCDRRFGVGADGLLYLMRSSAADFRMRLFNPDGSEGEMCGNGIRCAVKYYVERVRPSRRVRVETLAGIVEVGVRTVGGVTYYEVDMGVPHLRARDVPVELRDPDARALGITLELPELGKVELSAVNTGVPHAVIFVDNVDSLDVRRLGRAIRWHPAFPRGVNVDFAEVVGPRELKVRTYERGVEDETLCCGTGAAAVAVVATLLGKVDVGRDLTLRFRGGTLTLRVLVGAGGEVERITMTGTAHRVFEGVYDPD